MLCLNDTQAKVVREAPVGAPVGPLVVALGTGRRQGELLALTWDDVDLKNGTPTVRRSLAQTKGGFITKEPETAASRRTLTVPGFVVETLTKLKAVRLKALDKPVFCTRDGGYLCKKNVMRAFRGVVAKANKALQATAEGINLTETAANSEGGVKLIPEKVRFHDLRHSVASLLLSTGHSLKAVSQQLGHANPTMTLRVYARTMPNDDAKLVEGLAQIMA
ncbi:site-specific integrase [Gemmata sp. SH-PL17]|uniref:site-specific integrase n=1 Tax=Gemmata sp. SH-PL17 TaxID=1630693 RepID=UPI0009ED4432|nr:site-specific integrase [Gemmata sp. SH-PL17]